MYLFIFTCAAIDVVVEVWRDDQSLTYECRLSLKVLVQMCTTTETWRIFYESLLVRNTSRFGNALICHIEWLENSSHFHQSSIKFEIELQFY